MANQMDTRHAERSKLFSLFVAKKDPSAIDLLIYNSKASMEKEDVEAVRAEFEEWEATRDVN